MVKPPAPTELKLILSPAVNNTGSVEASEPVRVRFTLFPEALAGNVYVVLVSVPPPPPRELQDVPSYPWNSLALLL